MSNEMDAMAGGPGSDAIKGTENAPAQQKAEETSGAAATEAVADQNPAQPAPRKQLKSKKLDRTLEELESAFTNWESLNDTKAHAAEIKEDQRKAKDPSVVEEEFRKRTRMLLHQLRQQLADFSND